MICAYKIIHKATGKTYVGSTENLRKRLSIHWRLLLLGKHHNSSLQKLYNKCGKEGFKVRKRKCRTRAEAYEVEYKAMNAISESKLLNIGKGVIGGDNISRNPNYKNIVAKIKEASRRHIASLTDEQRKLKYSQPGERNGMYGRNHTEEAKSAISQKAKGNSYATGSIRSEGQRKKLSKTLKDGKLRVGELNGFYGKHHSDETKNLLREKFKGRLPANSKAVIIDGEYYASCGVASRELNIPHVTIWHRCQNTNPNFSNYSFA